MEHKSIFVPYERFVDCFLPAPAENEDGIHYGIEAFNLPRKTSSTTLAENFQQLLAVLNRQWLLPNDVAIHDPVIRKQATAALACLYRRSEAERVSGATQWTYAELLIEYRTDEPGDPFARESKSIRRRYESDAEGGDGIELEDVLQRILSDATSVFSSQHRTHLFTVLFFDTKACLIRWDRVGYVVSEPFDYVSEPQKLLLFIWRFARMSPEQRGHDSTASRVFPSSADYVLMRERAKPPTVNMGDAPALHEHARAAFAHSLKDAVFWRLRVDDAKKGPHYFLVGKPHFHAPELAGRGSRTYVAIDAADPYGSFVYLKDVWRIVGVGLKQEGSVLEILNSQDDGGPVPFVPTVRCHGHVEHQETLSQRLWKETHTTHQSNPGFIFPLRTYHHYRLVVNEVGLPLSNFQRGCELVGLLMCVIKAHGEAFTRKGFIHRDISEGNVLIYPTLRRSPRSGEMRVVRVALLTDWELAKRVDDAGEVDEGTTQPIHIGTWQFMSANALSHPYKRITVQDDMESIFHLLLYQAIRYLPSNCYDVRDFIREYFNAYKQQGGVYYGGREKMAAMKNGLLTNPRSQILLFYRSKPASTETRKPFRASSILADASPTIHMTIGTSTRMEPEPQAPGTPQPFTEGNRVLHPINDLLDDILVSLKAYYYLYDHEHRRTRSPTANVKFPVEQDFAEHLGNRTSTPTVRSSPADSMSPAERAQMESDAALLASHDAMVDLFLGYYKQMKSWPQDDRVPDALRD